VLPFVSRFCSNQDKQARTHREHSLASHRSAFLSFFLILPVFVPLLE
jgi:hypothetical protein